MYTEEMIEKVEYGVFPVAGTGGDVFYPCKVTFKDGKFCLGHSVENILGWMNLELMSSTVKV